ncbi:MAG TPA: Ldh family oxidoreductase [Patescibacteria group bacterium]|nr:Ldh family oxidoreductase [Patescibacteria group bacterium]
MNISVAEMTAKFKAVLATSGANQQDIDNMARLCLEQDLHHNYFSGLWDVKGFLEELQRSNGKKHIIEVDKPSLKLINCNERAVGLVSLETLPELCRMAKQQGIAIIGLYNGSYQSMPEVFARAIAAEGLVGLVASTGGPQSVVPYGGKKDILGTNPIAYGIPTDDLPIVFDAATAKYPYGSIQLTKERGEQLAEQSYLDKEGNWTTDPNKATAIVPFGEHRGYAINLLIEVMAGALVRAKSGLLQKDKMDMGAFLIAIDPEAFGPVEEFKAQTTKLAEDIEAVEPAEGFSEVRVPGYKGERYKQQVVAKDIIEIDDAIWQRFQAIYEKLVGKEQSTANE